MELETQHLESPEVRETPGKLPLPLRPTRVDTITNKHREICDLVLPDATARALEMAGYSLGSDAAWCRKTDGKEEIVTIEIDGTGRKKFCHPRVRKGHPVDGESIIAHLIFADWRAANFARLLTLVWFNHFSPEIVDHVTTEEAGEEKLQRIKEVIATNELPQMRPSVEKSTSSPDNENALLAEIERVLTGEVVHELSAATDRIHSLSRATLLRMFLLGFYLTKVRDELLRETMTFTDWFAAEEFPFEINRAFEYMSIFAFISRIPTNLRIVAIVERPALLTGKAASALGRKDVTPETVAKAIEILAGGTRIDEDYARRLVRGTTGVSGENDQEEEVVADEGTVSGSEEEGRTWRKRINQLLKKDHSLIPATAKDGFSAIAACIYKSDKPALIRKFDSLLTELEKIAAKAM